MARTKRDKHDAFVVVKGENSSDRQTKADQQMGWRPLVAAVLCALMLVACGKSSATNQVAEGQKKPPTEVGYIVMAAQDAPMHTELSGRVVAYRTAEVRPQVNGLIRSRLFREGGDVKAGSPLYQIDASTYRAAMESAQASLNKAQASLRATQLKAQRYKDLAAIKAVSQQDYDDAQAAFKQGQADVAAARANLNSQQVNLNYTTITAPISGRIGKSAINEGSLVTASQATALTTIQQLDPIYVDVSQSASDALRLREALQSGNVKSNGRTAVKLMLSDGSEYGSTGTLSFADAAIDQTSDSIALRTVFANPQRTLLPGMFVRIVLDNTTLPNALLIPQKALLRDATGKAMVWVIDADGKIAQRMVTTGQAIGNDWLVREDLQAGDKVVVDGFQKARVGDAVNGVLVTNAASAGDVSVKNAATASSNSAAAAANSTQGK